LNAIEGAEPRVPDWRAEVLIQSQHGMGGAAIGDLDPEHAGNEVAVVNAAGEVWQAYRVEGGWRSERIFDGDGELIMCAIGDVDPRHPGNEFVGVGMLRGKESRTGPGQVLMLRKDGSSWVADQIFQDNHMIHGVAVGNVSSRHPGNEVVACGFNHRVTLLSLAAERTRHEVIYVGNDRMKIAAIADALPQHDGLEVVVSGSDGNVLALWEDSSGWQHQVIYSDRAGQSRVACGEPGVLIGGDEGKVTLAAYQHDRWTTEFLARESGKIRGVAIADIDAEVPGAELYACGYSRNVLQIVQTSDGFWHAKVIFQAQRPLHHLVAGDVDPTHPGPELVTCGHGGILIVLRPTAGIPATR
jgi:hypothetical protein